MLPVQAHHPTAVFRRLGSGGKHHIGALAVAVGLGLAFAPAADAVLLPEDVARGCWFQTNGPSAPLDSGDWYTSELNTSTDRLHRFQITIPPDAVFPVTIAVRDAESRVGAADHDEVFGARDPTRFTITPPNPGAQPVTRTFETGAGDGATFAFVATAAHGPGTYVITSETGALAIDGDETLESNDDENAFQIEVTPDGRATSTTDDDVDVAFTQATIACTDTRSSLSLHYDVPAGTSTTTLRNFDLDSPGRVTGPLEYRGPNDLTVPGTASEKEVWNGPGEAGDTVPIGPGEEGPWTLVVFGLWAANQAAFEAYADGERLPLSLTFLPGNVAPTGTFHAPGTVEEGSQFNLFLTDVLDPDGPANELRYFFDCADNLLHGPLVDAAKSCQAGNDGTATVLGRVTDGNGGASTYDAQVEVVNVAPLFTPPPLRNVPLRPRATVALGRFSDPGPDAPWPLEVDWGDGTSHAKRNLAAAGALPALKHRFTRTGLHTLTVTLADNAESVTESFTVRVKRLCVVPNLKGKRLAGARKAIRRVDCRLGRVKRVFSAKVRGGRVISQKPKPGLIRARGTKITLVVSKGRRGRR